jgi:hypothetical protein
LRSIARNLLARADKCTLAAREVADRLDGKPAQAVDMQTEVVQHVVSDKPMTAEERAAEFGAKRADVTPRAD